MRTLRALLLIISFCLPVSGLAQEQQSYSYEYDEAGNIIAIRAAVNAGPPVVISVDPSLVNIDDNVPIILTGLNLFLATVTPDDASILGISNVQPASDTELTFDLIATGASLEDRVFTVSTALGSTTASVSIAERIPIIATDPTPLLLVENQVREMSILLDAPYVGDVNMNIEIQDGSIITLPNGDTAETLSVLIPSGETEFRFDVQALVEGTTEIKLTQLDNVQVSSVTVTVTQEIALPLGQHIALARPVGVRLDPLFRTAESIDAAPVGVSRRVLVEAGEKIDAQAVGIRKTILVEAGETIDSAPVGVEKN